MRNKNIWTLKEIASISLGDMNCDATSENLGGDVDWIWSDNLKNCATLPTRKLNAAVFRRPKSTRQILPEKILLIGKHNGEVFLGKTRTQTCINNSVIAVFPNERLVHKEFLYYALIFYREQIARLTKGLNDNFISAVRLKEFCMPKFSLAQQDELLAELSEIEALLDKFIEKIYYQPEWTHKDKVFINLGEMIQLSKVRNEMINKFFKRSTYDA